MSAALQISDLTVELERGAPILAGVDLRLEAGEVLGIVGESGSGKTTLALAALGYAREGARISGGTVEVVGEPILARGESQARRLRGRVVSYVPQEPGSALNPARRISDALRDMRRMHGGQLPPEDLAHALARVGLPTHDEFSRRFPHQLSGGQQQRVSIAMALLLEPPLIVLDEPTTGLDVITQAQILDEITGLRDSLGASMVYVTHDLAVVAQVATRVAVMYAGRIVEEGPTAEVLSAPRHPYTAGLVASIPDLSRPRHLKAMAGRAPGAGAWPSGCAFAPRCQLHLPRCDEAVPPLLALSPGHASRCVRPEDVTLVLGAPREREIREAAHRSAAVLVVDGLRAVHRGRGEDVIAAEDVSFSIAAGTCTALVGESGSGKTTIARSVAGLHLADAGSIRVHATELNRAVRARTREQRRQIQMVFQSPTDALNPRQRVDEQIARPAHVLRGLSRREAGAEAAALVERVRLPSAVLRRYPRELSGGERQRVGIARALAAHPDILICDEVTSALDVSVQAAVLELLGELQRELDLALLFITHDLGVVAAIADDVVVLDHGHITERGAVDQVLTAPVAKYTRRLLAAAPSIDRPPRARTPLAGATTATSGKRRA